MRKAFIRELCSLAADDKRIVLLTGDLGYMALEPFRDRFPERFINVGVAEQNMVGIATGLAEAGLRPYVYSIATFAALRPFEFIRNGPVRHNLPVRIVGMGGGFDYGHAGPTHYALEDIGVLRTLPGLAIVIPADSAQASTALSVTAALERPIYYSLGRDDSRELSRLNGNFEAGKTNTVRTGADVVLIAMGGISLEVAAAADELSRIGIEAEVTVVSSFSPDPVADMSELLSRHRFAVSIEAQTGSGGLGAFVSTVVASEGHPCRLKMLAVSSSPDGASGSQQDRWRNHGLDGESIVRAVCALIGGPAA
jgi:transketolase